MPSHSRLRKEHREHQLGDSQLQLAGRVKGTETLRVTDMATAILSLVPVVTTEELAQLVNQLSSGFLSLWQLAAPFEEVIPARHDFSPLELMALAGLLHLYQSPMDASEDSDPTLTSGIPPPGEAIEEGVEGHLCGTY